MIKTFLIEPTGIGRNYLRRYSYTNDGIKCGEKSYHDAQVFFADGQDIYENKNERQYISGTEGVVKPEDNDPRWPTECSCGYKFTAEDPHQLFHDSMMRRADTGEIKPQRDWEEIPGAMWDAYWYPWKGDDGKSLVVVLPDLSPWAIDSVASNCNEKDMPHHCWVRTGIAPNINVTKGGTPNHAGGGSIQSKGYHGFLTNGSLT